MLFVPLHYPDVFQTVTSPDRRSRLNLHQDMRVISEEEWMNEDARALPTKQEASSTQVPATFALSPTRTKTPKRLPLAALLHNQAPSASDPWPADTPARARHLAQMPELQGACSMMDNGNATAPPSEKKRPPGHRKLARRLTEAHLLSTQIAGPAGAGEGCVKTPDENDASAMRKLQQGQLSRPMPRSQMVAARRI